MENLGGGGQLYEAVGALTDFSSLADGIDRVEAQVTRGKSENKGMKCSSLASDSCPQPPRREVGVLLRPRTSTSLFPSLLPPKQLPFSNAVGRIQRGEPPSAAAAARLLALAGPGSSSALASAGALAAVGRSASMPRGGGGAESGSAGPPRALTAAEAYAEKKRAAMEHAAELRAAREREARAKEGKLSELEQLDAAFDRRVRR